MPCPLCKHDFEIPKDGVAGLTARTHVSESECSPSDIVQAAGDVRIRAGELLQKHVVPAEYLAPSFHFIPADTDQLLRDDRNFIGDVATDTGMQFSFLS